MIAVDNILIKFFQYPLHYVVIIYAFNDIENNF
jgi:hypothetical protein